MIPIEPKETTEGSDEAEVEEGQKGFSFARAFTSLIIGCIVGGIAAWATVNMGISTVTFFIVAIITTFLLYRKNDSSRLALGSGLYAVALVFIINPLLFYLPVIMESGEAETAESAGTFIGSTLGIVIWGFVALLFSIVIAAVGYFIRRQGS